MRPAPQGLIFVHAIPVVSAERLEALGVGAKSNGISIRKIFHSGVDERAPVDRFLRPATDRDIALERLGAGFLVTVFAVFAGFAVLRNATSMPVF